MKQTVLTPFTKKFGYLGQLIELIKQGKDLPVDEIYQWGSRKSAKTNNDMNFLSLLPLTNRKIKVIEIKDKKTNIEETIFAEALNSMKAMNAPIHWRRKEPLRFKSYNTDYSFYSLYEPKSGKVALTGLSKLEDYEYVFILIDEAYDIKADDYASLSEAVRGCERLVVIFTLNPWNIGHWLVQRMMSYKPFNLGKIKKDYDDFSFIKNKRVIVHYSCYLGNNMLKQADKERLEKDASLRPIGLRDTILFGSPGMEEGAIYAPYLDKVGSPSKTPYEFSGWIDVGYKRDMTHAGFVGTDIDRKKRMVYEEWSHSNLFGVFKDVEQQCKDICRFFINMLTKMTREHGIGRIFRTKIFVDRQDIAFIQQINKIKYDFGEAGDYLEFVPCEKIAINDRIDKTIYEMNAGILEIDRHKCPVLWQELSMSQWDETLDKTEKKRKDGNDHGINGLEYETIANWNRG